MNRLIRTVLITVLLAASVHAGWGASGPVKPEVAIRNAFPQLKVDSIFASEVPGLYEVISGQNVYYFVPEKEYMVVGEIFTKEGRNITQDRKQSLMASKLKDLPLGKAVKIGSGKTVVVEFTDPDCPYCRRASEALRNRTDITRYIFLAPMAHPNAVPKVHHILNAEDKAKAYEEMMGGAEAPRPGSDYPDAIKQLAAEHMEWAKKIGVSGTPTFFINGKAVVGADLARIDALVKEAEATRQAH
jgi:thiol:disulfide interchange protein DsbC